MIAGVILAPALVELGDLDAAEQVFEEVIALCERSEDRLHLGAAYANRAWLWSARGQVSRTADDLRRVIQLAREIGQSSLERIATYNLAEDLLWRGELDEALALARRCLAIQIAHGEGSTRPDRLLLARLLAAAGLDDELEGVLATFDREDLADDEIATLRVLRAACAPDDSGQWEGVFDAIETLPPSQRLELIHVMSKHDQLSPAQRDAARALAAENPFWSVRASEL
jgi:tetratricopeptide (TPR) repeat protein